jgi:dTDP-4-dehydrorhamnose reductase
MRVLLTGATGQLGRALQRALSGHEVSAFARGDLDVTDMGAVRAAVASTNPDVAINAAAYNDVDGAETDRAGAYRANALGPRHLALATAERDAALLHVSTDYVFDGESREPYHEASPTNPLSVYGRSKLEGEEAVRSVNPRHFVVRTAWLFGVGGRNFPETMLRLAERGPVRVVADQHGSPTYAPHLAEALAGLIATDRYGTHHCAGRGEATWFDLARALFRLAGVDAAVHPIAAAELPRPARRPSYSVLSTTQASPFLLPPWEDGLAAFVSERSLDPQR